MAHPEAVAIWKELRKQFADEFTNLKCDNPEQYFYQLRKHKYGISIIGEGYNWHNREDIKKKDKAKNAYLKVSGWVLLRFWEHEIKDDINKCVQIIQEEICKT